jgi:hypothetical protein
MLGTIGMQGQANHELCWLPIRQQSAYRFELCIITCSFNQRQCAGLAQQSITNRYADALEAKIKGDHCGHA